MGFPSIETVKRINDVAEAVHHYAQMQKLSTEVINHAMELKLRVERRAGEILRGMEKNKGGRAEKPLAGRVGVFRSHPLLLTSA